MVTDWEILIEQPGLACIRVGNMELRPGNRVRIRRRDQTDIVDCTFEGKTAVIDSIEQEFENGVYLAVRFDHTPGSDNRSEPAHHFVFRVDEVELLPG